MQPVPALPERLRVVALTAAAVYQKLTRVRQETHHACMY